MTMQLACATRECTDDCVQDLLLGMNFSSTELQQPQQKVARVQRHGVRTSAASVDVPFSTNTTNTQHRTGPPSTTATGLQLPGTPQSSKLCMLGDSLQVASHSLGAAGKQMSSTSQILGSVPLNAQLDPIPQDSGSGDAFMRDRAGWDVATAGTFGDSSAKAGSRQDRTERQQMLNKAAQQRYRERKKAKANELKQAVTDLQDRVQELSKVHAEKDALQEKVSALENELAGKEARLHSLQKTQLGPSIAQAHSAVTGPGSEGGSAQYAQRHIEEVQRLKSWLGTHGYLSGGMMHCPLGVADILPEKLRVLEKLVRNCYASCHVRLKTEGSLDADGGGSGRGGAGGEGAAALLFQGSPSQWQQLVEQLALAGTVRQQLLQLRARYMHKLEDLFQRRKQLNVDAVRVLLPMHVGAMSLKPKAAISTSLFAKLSSAYDTASVLRRLRGNLGEEQKALAELDYLVYMKLLDPVQLSRCILTAFPQHCDVVSLLNAINSAS